MPLKILQKITNNSTRHLAQASCLRSIQHDESMYLISSGIDQRVKIFEIPSAGEPKLLQNYITSVADLTSFDILRIQNQVLIFLAGHGLEVLKFNLSN